VAVFHPSVAEEEVTEVAFNPEGTGHVPANVVKVEMLLYPELPLLQFARTFHW
jgi:hypothetical protein